MTTARPFPRCADEDHPPSSFGTQVQSFVVVVPLLPPPPPSALPRACLYRLTRRWGLRDCGGNEGGQAGWAFHEIETVTVGR
jgi:hypothetical protein